MTATRTPGFAVKGVRFHTPAEARAAARRLRDDAEEYALAMRKRGQDAKADKVVDQANEQADAYDTAASEHDTKPSPPPRAAAKTPRRAPSRSGGGARRGGSRSSVPRPVWQVVGGWGELAGWVIVSMVVIALLRLIVGTTRGPSGYAWLVGKASGLVSVIIAPVDPLGGLPATPPDTALTMAGQALGQGHNSKHDLPATGGRKHKN